MRVTVPQISLMCASAASHRVRMHLHERCEAFQAPRRACNGERNTTVRSICHCKTVAIHRTAELPLSSMFSHPDAPTPHLNVTTDTTTTSTLSSRACVDPYDICTCALWALCLPELFLGHTHWPSSKTAHQALPAQVEQPDSAGILN